MKRAVTKVIFSKLHVDAEMIADHDLTDGIKGLIEAGAAGRQTNRTGDRPDESSSTLDEDGAASIMLPTPTYLAWSSRTTV